MAALSLVVVAIILGLGVLLIAAFPIVNAADRKASSRTAADAAALAGVDWIRKDLETVLTNKGWLGHWEDFQPFVGTGLASAQNYAARNNAELVSYSFDITRWEATAKVRGPALEDGQMPVSEATARLDMPECQSEEVEPTPTPTPPPDEDDEEEEEEEPEPPPPPGLELKCDGLDLTLDPKTVGNGVIYQLPGWAIGKLLGDSLGELVD